MDNNSVDQQLNIQALRLSGPVKGLQNRIKVKTKTTFDIGRIIVPFYLPLDLERVRVEMSAISSVMVGDRVASLIKKQITIASPSNLIKEQRLLDSTSADNEMNKHESTPESYIKILLIERYKSKHSFLA